MRFPARIVTTLAAVGLAVAVVSSGAESAPEQPPELFDGPRPLDRVPGDRLAEVARASGLAIEQVDRMARGGHFEVDRSGRVRSVEPAAPELDGAGPDVPPGVDVFTLHSRPGSNRTIYLDFTGHTVEGTAWNGGARIDAPPFDDDGDPSTFNEAERAEIYQAFLAIAEDYRPFDVDVTTQEPAQERITRSGAADQVFGTRAVITPTDVTNCGCGGQAYIGVFDEANRHATYQPAWAYTRGHYDGKAIAEIVSHETGHNLGLGHDGQPGVSYYTGHTNWAPIMGAGYYQPVSQWSKGEYANPSNTEDDLAVIGENGAARLADDHPDTADSATPLTGTATGIIATESDVDVFAVQHAGGALTVAAVPASFGSNLDIRLAVRDAAGTVLATVDPPVSRISDAEATGLDARLSQNLPAGRYTIHIQGTGFGDPASNGYTRYASLGQYTLTI